MNVFYNFELDEDLSIKYLDNPKLIVYLSELKEFVKERLKVLQEEIFKEENESPKCVVIAIPDKEDSPEGIYYMGYSEKLMNKMKTCITESDIIYLQDRLLFIFDSFK